MTKALFTIQYNADHKSVLNSASQFTNIYECLLPCIKHFFFRLLSLFRSNIILTVLRSCLSAVAAPYSCLLITVSVNLSDRFNVVVSMLPFGDSLFMKLG